MNQDQEMRNNSRDHHQPWKSLVVGDELELDVCDDRFVVSAVGSGPAERSRRVVAANKRTGHQFRIEWVNGEDRTPHNWGVVVSIYRKWAEVLAGDWKRLAPGDEISLKNGSRYSFIKRRRSGSDVLLILYNLSEKTLHEIRFKDGDMEPPEKWSLVVAVYTEESANLDAGE